jgi:hypothetical protein
MVMGMGYGPGQTASAGCVSLGMADTDRIAGECRTADAEEKKSQYLRFSSYMSGLWECFLLGSLELSLLTCVEGYDIYTVGRMATPVYTSAIDFGL